MNLFAGAPVWLLAILVLALIAAAVEDAARLRISNVTVLVVLGTAIVAAIVEGPSLSLWQNALLFLVILALGTAAFAGGWLGGGDVKLFAAAALWADLRIALWLVALVFLSGGLLAIAYLASRPLRRSSGGKRIPYGIAIAAGTLAVMALSRGYLQDHSRQLPPIKIIRPSA